MSARVYTPIGMADLRNIMSAYENANHGDLPPSPGSTPPDSSDIARVRRNLFGPVDHEENRRFLERELALQQASAGDRWGFDFDKGTPRTSGMGTARYAWEKVTPTDVIPESYALLRMTSLQNIAVDDDEEAAVTTTPMVDDDGKEVQDVAKPQRQSQITEFMQKRKKPYSNGAKTLPPVESTVGPTRTKKSRSTATSTTTTSS